MSGYYGVPNFGDELILRTLVDLATEDSEFEKVYATVRRRGVSPGYTARDIVEVEGFTARWGYWKSFLLRLRAIRDSSVVVIGGGGLINDTGGVDAPLRYLGDALLATALGRRPAVFGIGAPAMDRPLTRAFVKAALGEASVVAARDERSFLDLDAVADRADISVVPDIAHAGAPFSSRGVRRAIPKPYVVVNFRENPKLPMSGCVALVELASKHAPFTVLLGAEPPDRRFLDSVRAQLSAEIRARSSVEIPLSVDDSLAILAGSALVVGERFHVVLASLHCGVPLYIIEYEEKVRALRRAIRRSESASTDLNLACRTLSPAFSNTIEPSAMAAIAAEASEAYRSLLHAAAEAEPPNAPRRVSAGLWWLAAVSVALGVRTGRGLRRLLHTPTSLLPVAKL